MSSLQKLDNQKNQPKRKKKNSRNLWFERAMAIVASANLFLVVFDLSYIPLRDFWLQRRIQVFSFKIGPIVSKGFPVPIPIPNITPLYDPIKGIEPYRDTAQYLERVTQLQSKLIEPGLRSPEVASILEDLRRRSTEMINTNPFQIANKTGNLEKIKNKIVQHLPTPEDSAKESLIKFWSVENLGKNPLDELNFFDKEIRPLIETNYFRPLGENGQFLDLFGIIDFPFFVLFSIEFLGRSWSLSRRHIGVSWLDAMLWRWYDLFLLIPLWRWLRIIPVTIRLDQAKLIDLSAIQKQIRQGFVAEIAGDMTQVIVIRVINEAQDSIRRGEIANWLSQREARPYIDLNNTDEVATLTKIGIQLTVYKVLPEIRSDLEALLKHHLEKILKQSQVYDGLEKVPGVGQLRNQLTEKLVKQITQTIYDGANIAIEEDPVGEQLLQILIKHVTEAYGSQLQTKQTLEDVQSLIVDFLEEMKVNYIERLSEEDLEEILDQSRAIGQIKSS
ncbi:MAG TPA: hypothetical protein DEG17_26705 [Cyanobacteria bacterium UBA11149]|nr:hypothetical protein [Cyanobacteria bacterium UBA11367]HBE60921.1 hypothetical protein [Cyanobacteria bacterium UBA11366]HBK62422.1 hypothetical protein [Cyanobacteria bacterium UBA11166]HBR76384.1 hypothetical protein [Cyanobacteria bacterium UBA11159]HBS72039.1 hypothetical protein [Cyanobacteria bacterium UBA11153]HBW92360.1 hypothetical protein [Cyanobacteria bacterium UBA11149]HCA95452.1 hypothetical protein [Cyanobacteria bacterium UBA9226]